jgi:hypothetical protein
LKLTKVSITKGSTIRFKYDGQWYNGEVAKPLAILLTPAPIHTGITRGQSNTERWWKISKQTQTFRAMKKGEKLRPTQKFFGTQAALRTAFPGFHREYAKATPA